jgi:type II secretory ATPase GspE/PulE/Tfp pilus assembly ATPase PilB-like protein
MVAELSVINLVDALVNRAIDCHASDIHLESQPDKLRVRYRIDGLLYDQESLSALLALQILSRIKILGHLDISQKRIPQDGKFRLQYDGRAIDLRVSSFPSIYGEKIVIRILDHRQNVINLDDLGMSSSIHNQFNELINKQNGFLLVAGPTGSGKTTTLYAALSGINNPEKNIITLEDPVEYHIEGVTQGQIHPPAGFTFARGIRSMLRQDPDVVMIGEVRDTETARIAIEAALTGHLVLSTVHTNSAPAVIMRLMDMGIEPFLINAANSGILAQRLARKLCTLCRVLRRPTDQEQIILERIDLPVQSLYESTGCDNCFNLGYKGRIGIFELLIMSDQLRTLIVQHPSFEAISKQAMYDGLQPMLEDAKLKVKEGAISLAELARILL